MSNLFFWLVVYGKCVNFLWLIFGLSLGSIGVLLLTSLIMHLNSVNYFGRVEHESLHKKAKSMLKYLKIPIVIFTISLTVVTLIPNKKEIITYYIIKQVDNYNIEHEASNFNPDNIMKNVDQTISKISELADNLLGKLNNKVEE